MKFLKWILGLFALIGGAIAMFIPKSKNEKVKKIEQKIKTADDIIKASEEENKEIRKTLANKKKVLDEIKKQKDNIKVKEKGSAEAADFLKKYAKKKGKK